VFRHVDLVAIIPLGLTAVHHWKSQFFGQNNVRKEFYLLDRRGIKMDVSLSSLTGALRIGVQVVSTAKHPVVEFYQTHFVRNHGENNFTSGMNRAGIQSAFKSDKLDQFVQFSVANIGTVRAENLKFTASSTIPMVGPSLDFGGMFVNVLSQLAPGQVIHLFRVDVRGLVLEDAPLADSNAPIEVAVDQFLGGKIEIICEYDHPPGLVNSIKKYCFPGHPQIIFLKTLHCFTH